ncbi:MAG: paraquat-inducible protein A [Reyranella sp.]|uniref:paraquat-inducible protein A n=1 Tax=Reyranella sp. TaxID=1929291 RepID=UPI001ACB5C23|nr:paraquat-inducible protein A [Reyranella sp.]MBN9090931.1 paraquat-inducible protein A [Reyranella sp.]
MTEPQLRECFGCGLFQLVPALGPDMRSNCLRCGTTLRHTRANSLDHCLAVTAGGLVAFIVLWTATLMQVSQVGIVHETNLMSGPAELVRHGLWPLALAVAFTTAIAPLAMFAGTLYVLVGLRMRRPPPGLARVFLFARKMGVWAMLEVLLLGVFVAYTKLGDLVHIEVGPAVYALGALAILTVWADNALDPAQVWEEIERRGQSHDRLPPVPPIAFLPGAVGCEACGLVSVPAHDRARCPRCGSALHARKPDVINRTWAFVIAGAILYIPANYYPVLTVIQMGAGAPSTIMGGVIELLDSKMYPLALLVFFASILVPVFKLAALTAMLITAKLAASNPGTALWLRERTRLYYIVAWVGRWSMVDIFMESLLGALVQFGAAVNIAPGIGAVAFCAVVILTIFAAEGFDPRLMWDAAARNPHRLPADPAIESEGSLAQRA